MTGVPATATATDALTGLLETPALLHCRVYVFAEVIPVRCSEPPVADLAPLQSPVAVHESAAPVTVHVSVAVPPDATVAGDAVRDTCGAPGGWGADVTHIAIRPGVPEPNIWLTARVRSKLMPIRV
jgi:hypothetical protein